VRVATEPQKEKIMKFIESFQVKLVFLCLISCLMVSCESDGGGGDEFQRSDSYRASGTVDGTWNGISSTSQVHTILHLSESNGRIVGNLKWPNDSRTISGSRSGETIQFYVEGGDRWSLVFANDNTLVGTAVKPDGNTYALSFSR